MYGRRCTTCSQMLSQGRHENHSNSTMNWRTYESTQHVVWNCQKPQNMSKTISNKISLCKTKHSDKKKFLKTVLWEIGTENSPLEKETSTKECLDLNVFVLHYSQLPKAARDINRLKIWIWSRTRLLPKPYTQGCTTIIKHMTYVQANRIFRMGLQLKLSGSQASACRAWCNNGWYPTEYIYGYVGPKKILDIKLFAQQISAPTTAMPKDHAWKFVHRARSLAIFRLHCYLELNLRNRESPFHLALAMNVFLVLKTFWFESQRQVFLHSLNNDFVQPDIRFPLGLDLPHKYKLVAESVENEVCNKGWDGQWR